MDRNQGWWDRLDGSLKGIMAEDSPEVMKQNARRLDHLSRCASRLKKRLDERIREEKVGSDDLLFLQFAEERKGIDVQV